MSRQNGKAKNEQSDFQQHDDIQEKQVQNEYLHANAQRLLREQRDMARITAFGRRDE